MTLNFENVGIPIAIIKKEGKKNTPVIFLDEKSEARHNLLEIITKDGETIQPIPNPAKERSCIFVAGQSGSGKSYWTFLYVSEWKRLFPKREVYLFSSLTSDTGSIDKIKNIKKIKVNEDLLNDDLTAEDFKDSLVIFDDTDCLTNKKIKLKVNGILNNILETGRHHNVYCIYTSHQCCKGAETKTILNECSSVVLFPSTVGGKTLKYLLDSYFGLDKKQILKLKHLKSRWVVINRTYPLTILSEKEAYVLKVED